MEQVKCKNSLAEAELAKGFETYFSCWVNVMVDEIGEVIEQELKTHLAEAKRNVIDELGNFMSLAEAKASDVISSVEEDVEKAASKAASKGKELVSKGIEAAKKIVTFMDKTKTELESLLQTVEDKRDEVFTRVNENIIKLKSIIDMNAMTFSDLLKAGATKFNKENGKLSLEYVWSTSIKTTIDTLVMHMDKFMKAFSAGRSFSKRAEYSKGLMKGWVATGYAVAEAQLSGIPHLSAKARAAIGIDYHGTKQQRRGNLLELSLSPSVAIENVADIPMGLKDDIARGEENGRPQV